MANILPANNGWAEYQRLVLAELERHNALIEKQNTKLSEIALNFALLKQQYDAQIAINRELVAKIDALDGRMDVVERGTDISQAISKYRKYIVGALIALASSVIIPIIKILFFPGA